MNELLELCRKKLLADGLKKSEPWQGYEVYSPVYSKPLEIGLPKIVLVKDGVIRISTSKECFKYMNFIKQKKN